MGIQTFERSIELPATPQAVFDWHAAPGAFERLTPPWERVQLVSHAGIEDGATAVIETRIGPVKARWVAQHQNCQPGQSFEDVQLSGPFAQWEHTHSMEAIPTGCRLTDHIEYQLPVGSVGSLLGSRFVSEKLQRMFAYRHRVTRDDFVYRTLTKENRTMKIAITGASGLIGQTLCPMLTTAGHSVVKLTRGEATADDELHWKPSEGKLDESAFEGCDAVVHLAGENIGEGRWTEAKKKRIVESRVNSTELIASVMASMSSPPPVLVCASAIGYYGDRADEELTEQSEPGDSFLADVCIKWEQAADAARQKGLRVAHIRTGMVLSPEGGALAAMLLPFKLGAGGRVGSGNQWWSWIGIDDAAAVFQYAIENESIEGPVNSVSPHAVTNREFTKVLGDVLNRPTILPMPAFGARLVLGEMADGLILASTRVVPQRLSESGYSFRYPQLDECLRHVLGR